MTVKVIVEHSEQNSNRPIVVKVAEMDVTPGGEKQYLSELRQETVMPGESAEFYVHRNQSIMIDEAVDPLPVQKTPAKRSR